MLLPFCFGLHVVAIVSLSLRPQQAIDLSVNSSFSYAISNTRSRINNTISSLDAVTPLTPLLSNLSTLGQGRYNCDRSKYGQPPINSCYEAYARIVGGREVVRYGDRSAPGAADVVLPARYSSSA